MLGCAAKTAVRRSPRGENPSGGARRARREVGKIGVERGMRPGIAGETHLLMVSKGWVLGWLSVVAARTAWE